MPSYLFTSIEPTHTFDLGTLDSGLLKSTVTDGVAVPERAVPADAVIDGDYQPGSKRLFDMASVDPAGNSLVVSSGTEWTGLSGGAGGQVLTKTNDSVEWTTPITSIGISSTTLNVSGSPLTENGSITVNLNTVLTDKGGTGLDTFTAGDTVYYSSGTALTKVGIGAEHTVYVSTGTEPAWVGGTPDSGDVLTFDGADIVWDALPASGTVTSVGIASTDLDVSGSPVTTAGDITVNLNTVTTAKGGTGLTTYTEGDLPYYSSGTALSKLGIGATGRILQSNGTAPAWVLPPYLTVTTIGAAATAGDATITSGNNSVTVNTTAVTSSSIILCSIGGLTGTSTIGAQGPVGVTSISDGTSFVITGNAAVPGASTLVVHWLIVA